MSEPHVDLPRRRPTAAAAPAREQHDGEHEPTGDAAVDAALVDLQAIDPDLGPGEQLPVLLAVHEALQQRLSSTEG